MSPEDIKKLLGGYATGTLTAAEQEALFAAALDDQELFDALAREQPLRDLLRDPAARAELLSALNSPASRPGGFWQWLRRPMVAGLAVAAVAEIALVGVAVWKGTHVVRPAPTIVAEMKRPDAAAARRPSIAGRAAGQADGGQTADEARRCSRRGDGGEESGARDGAAFGRTAGGRRASPGGRGARRAHEGQGNRDRDGTGYASAPRCHACLGGAQGRSRCDGIRAGGGDNIRRR